MIRQSLKQILETSSIMKNNKPSWLRWTWALHSVLSLVFVQLVSKAAAIRQFFKEFFV